MKKKISIFFLLLCTSICLYAQAYRGIRVSSQYKTSYDTYSGIVVKSITPQLNGSFEIVLFNNNYAEPNEIATYNFKWYLSYKNKRVSDYFQSSIRTQRYEESEIHIWPNEVPKGYEKYVSVQFGEEPRKKDRRDDD